jgi:hypothetical protein
MTEALFCYACTAQTPVILSIPREARVCETSGGVMPDTVPFFAECPNCGNDRVQPGYPRDELQQLLDAGAEIMAYCTNCDEHWAVSTEERVDIARGLSKPATR